MPELPEVNTFQRYFEAAALGRQIAKVQVQDAKIIRNIDEEAFASRLGGRTFVSTYRQGKYLFGRLDDGADVLLHFGMTGDLSYYSEADEPPRFERFAFVFFDGTRLGFLDARKFARVLYLEDRAAYLAAINLGPDVMTLREADFLRIMEGKKISLKGFLLNQSLLAGVGNLYADEICYQARVHPASRVNALPLEKRTAIFQYMQSILRQAIDQLPYYKDYPEEWLWNRWRYEGATAADGISVVEKTNLAGRTTYFASHWQQLYE